MSSFISSGVHIFHCIPPSPRLSSALWFLSFFCVLKELTVLLSLGVLSVCALHCSLPLSVMRKAWKNNVWGQSETPLMSVSSLLLALCSRFSRWQRWSLQISYRCELFHTCCDVKHTLIPAWYKRLYIRTGMSAFNLSHRCSCTCSLCHHQQKRNLSIFAIVQKFQ